MMSFSCSSFLLLRLFVTPAGIEPTTYGLEGRCSIQLSYGAKTAAKIVNYDVRSFTGRFIGHGVIGCLLLPHKIVFSEETLIRGGIDQCAERGV